MIIPWKQSIVIKNPSTSLIKSIMKTIELLYESVMGYITKTPSNYLMYYIHEEGIP